MMWIKNGVEISEFGLTSRCGIGPDDKVQSDSARFPNEEGAIQGNDGITILIRRKGTGPAAFKWSVLGLALGRWLYKATSLIVGRPRFRAHRSPREFSDEVDAGSSQKMRQNQ